MSKIIDRWFKAGLNRYGLQITVNKDGKSIHIHTDQADPNGELVSCIDFNVDFAEIEALLEDKEV